MFLSPDLKDKAHVVSHGNLYVKCLLVLDFPCSFFFWSTDFPCLSECSTRK